MRRMMTFKRLLVAAAIVPGCWFTITLGYAAYRNVQGYCAATSMRLSDADRIDIAITQLLRHYPTDARELARFNHWSQDLHAVPVPEGSVPLAYKGINHFKSLNPDCCTVQDRPASVDSPPVSNLNRMTGAISSFVVLNYRVRYIEPSGRQGVLQGSADLAITNCGKAWSGF